MQIILVADDSTLMVKMLESVITIHYGQSRIVTATSGAQAIEQWRAERPCLTILDVHMPDQSGIEVLELIKAEDPNAKVIMLTADRHEETEAQCRRLGADAFVLKGQSAAVHAVIKDLLPQNEGVTA